MRAERYRSSQTLEPQVRALADATGSRVTLLEWKERPGGPPARPARARVLPAQRLGRAAGRAEGVRARGARAIRTGKHAERLRQLPGRGHRHRRPADRPEEGPAVGGRLLAQLRGGRRDRLLHPRARALGLRRGAAGRADRRLVRRAAPGSRACGASSARPTDVARGHFDREPLPVDSEDELGQLTRTFNAMQQQLREVDIARKEFIATASHELRTPIFSLAGFVELLQDEDLDDETRREFVDTMREQVERLQKLSVDLLDLSRLDSGSVELHTEPVDLAELTRSVVGEFRPALQDHRTELRMEVPEEGPLAECDRERVAQIMRILLDNALRHTPAGTDVTVSAAARERVRRVHGGGRGAGAAAAARATRRSSASTPATPRAGRPRARDRPRACRAHGRPARPRRPPGQHRLRPPAAHERIRIVRRALAARGRGARARRGRLRCLRRRRRRLGLCEHDARGHDDARRGRGGHRPRGRLRSRPDLLAALARCGHGHLALRRRRPACSRTAARAARARASCSTTTATSPRTRTS